MHAPAKHTESTSVSDACSDGIFLAERGAQSWQSRQGAKQGEPQDWRKFVDSAPQKKCLGMNITWYFP